MNAPKFSGLFFIIFMICTVVLNAQDKEAKITLAFENGDSLKICKAAVTSNDSAVKEVAVKLYVQRMFSLLPVGDGTTDDEGIVNFEFPNDIPADQNGKLTIIAKIEDDENYKNTETRAEIDWGLKRNSVDSESAERSLSASRDKAPIYFIVATNLIIIGIWGTLIYVVLQIFKIKKISKHLNK